MKAFNILILFLLVACSSTNSIHQTGSSYTDDQINQFCWIRSLTRSQGNPRIEGEKITKNILTQYNINEQRFGEILRAQILDSTIQMVPNELAMLKQLKNENHKVLKEKKKNESELILSNGMNPNLYYSMLNDYRQSTSFQNRVYKTCQNS